MVELATMQVLPALGVGSVLGAVVTLAVQAMRSSRQGKAAQAAIQAEVDNAAREAASYLAPGAVRRVGWRLSCRMFETGLPKMIEAGMLSREAAEELVRHYQNVEAFNRSLDQIEDHRSGGRTEMVKKEIRRACLKAMQIVSARQLRQIADARDCEPWMARVIRLKLDKGGGRTLHDRVWPRLG